MILQESLIVCSYSKGRENSFSSFVILICVYSDSKVGVFFENWVKRLQFVGFHLRFVEFTLNYVIENHIPLLIFRLQIFLIF